MRFRLRSLLVLVAVIACLLPALKLAFQHWTYPHLHFCESGRPTKFNSPYVHCMTAHEPIWGPVRLVFLQRIETEEQWKQKKPMKWLKVQMGTQVNTRIYVRGQLISPSDTVTVYYAQGDSPPREIEFDYNKLPLRDPWWVDSEKLWQLIQDRTAQVAD